MSLYILLVCRLNYYDIENIIGFQNNGSVLNTNNNTTYS